jgi:5-methyltetrahydropteroyltriglutamate--homocysteine methyltransferase
LHEPLYRSMDLRIAYEKAVNRMLEGLDDLISIWHICYGSVDAQTDVWEDKAAEMMPMFETANVTAIHFESAHRGFREKESYRGFPRNKVLGLGFIDVKEPNVEKPEEVAKRIRRVLDTGIVTPERLLVMPDCGLGYMSRTVAAAKLSAMGAGVKMVREGLYKSLLRIRRGEACPRPAVGWSPCR